jgi:hypothetical protein
MADQSTTSRSLHDLGLAAWFGGSLMGAVGLNGATGELRDPTAAGRVANAGWARWTPVNLAAITAYLVGSVGLIDANKGRLAAQQGAASVNATKSAVTVAALLVTAWARLRGRTLRKVEQTSGMPADDATTPVPQTPEKAAKAQRSLRRLQWLIPALTGTLLVLNAKAGEQQRPAAVARGVWGRLRRG